MLANSFLMPRGYTIVWSGWERLGHSRQPHFNSTASFPIARNPRRLAITGPSYEYIVAGGGFVGRAELPGGDAGQDQGDADHRVHLNDAPQVIRKLGWNYRRGPERPSASSAATFVANDIDEFAYIAKDPKVNGLGFAAVRDWMEFLRYERRDDYGNPNPLARHMKRVYTEISSQPGRC